MSEFKLIPRARDVAVIVLAIALAVVFTAPAEAIDLSGKSGKYRLNLNTTLSWGGRYRMEERDPAIISPTSAPLRSLNLNRPSARGKRRSSLT